MATSGKKTHSSVQKSSANSGILHLLPSFSVLVVSCQLLSKVLRHEPVSPAAGEYIYNIIHNLKENIKIHREKRKKSKNWVGLKSSKSTIVTIQLGQVIQTIQLDLQPSVSARVFLSPLDVACVRGPNLVWWPKSLRNPRFCWKYPAIYWLGPPWNWTRVETGMSSLQKQIIK